MLALPHVSGTECIDVLLCLGFRAHRRAGGLATLLRGRTAVIVPETTLGPALIASILRAASVDPLDFLAVLEMLERRGSAPSAPTSAVA
jgi:predicted RNA binding protein YcfA (HicA-like mRNA interferase family)